MSKQLPTYIALALLCVASFLAFNWIYGYVIVFQSETNDCFFLFGQSFLWEFLEHPAGPIRYVGRFLGQFSHYRWLGAIVIAASIACFGLLFHGILRKLNQTVSVSQTLLPCVLLLALHTSTLYVLHDTLGLCTSCLAFLVYLSLAGATSRRVYALVATPIVYLVAGAYVWILVAWIIADLCFGNSLRSKLVFGTAYAVLSIAVPLIAWRWFFMIPMRSALTCPIIVGHPFRTGSADQSLISFTVDCALAVSLCGVLLLIPYWGRLFSSEKLVSFWQVGPDRRSRIVMALAICVVLIMLNLIRYDAPLATIVAYRQLYKEREWDALLERAQQDSYEDHRVQFMTNFALCQKGKLLEEMFSYPQPCGTRGLFLNFTGTRVASRDEDDTGDGMYNSDLLYELGQVTFSFRHAYNCITTRGRTYKNLERMAECSIVNGNYALATKYLNVLEKTLFHREFARHYKEIIADPDAMEKEFSDLRSRLPTVDGFGHPTAYFVTLLESKPDNRKALDYLMAWLMLDKTPESMESLCADIGHLRDVGRTTIPRHCQEAVLLNARLFDRPVDPRGFSFDTAIVNQVEEFKQDLLGQGEWLDTKAARASYGDTYMYYWFFATTESETGLDAGSGGGFSATAREE